MVKDKTWKGRIKKESNLMSERFTSSINIDKNLYVQDIIATAAYVKGLKSIGILNTDELNKILSGLIEVKKSIESNSIKFEDYEDIHSLVEYELFNIIGSAAKKIHTGRSRNDQIVVDEILFLKESIITNIQKLIALEKSILQLAENNIEIIFPAYTHMQKAQPVLLSHYLLSYFDKFERNIKKLVALFDEIDFLPLGAAACAGSGYNINQKMLAKLLKFSRIGKNSMDIVSSRDYIIDYIYCCSLVMLNLSRFCEDLIIYNSQEFSYIEINESFCTGSSIMPQKKNPDILELIRGKSAVVAGNLTQVLTLIKGLPSTYNSDLQEDKKILFNAKKETLDSIEIFGILLKNIKFNKNIIQESLKSGHLQATDAADYLTKKGVSFRKAHNIVGRIVGYCIENNLELKDISLDKLKSYSSYFEGDFYIAIDIENCINSKITGCGTSQENISEVILNNKKALKDFEAECKILLNKTPVLSDVLNSYNR